MGLFVRLFFALSVLISAQAQAEADPFAARLHYDDVERFYQVYDKAKGSPSAKELQRGYLEVGSSGLQNFISNRIESPEALAIKIASEPEIYERARTCMNALPKVERRMRSVYLAFQAAYPEADLPDVTILIGRGNSGGTANPSGVLIGLEVICDPALDSVGFDAMLTHLIAHELVHTQQTYFEGDSLLVASLNEGIAEFIGELISGSPINAPMFSKADARAPKIEQDFAAEMLQNETSRWLYNGAGTEAWPGDLGYWTGYRIARNYFDKATDKRAAIHTMLKSTDAKVFLEASGWTPAKK